MLCCLFVFSCLSSPPPLRKLYTKLRCDDQPLLEHAEQLLGELGGEVEADEGNPKEDEEFEPCSDEEEESAMEH